MNHQKAHDQIIKKFRGLSKQEVRDIYGYSEHHHVKPRFLSGSDDDFNRVHLPARYHFVVHRLLAKIEPNRRGHWEAVSRMSYSKKHGIKVTSRTYETLKANLARLGRPEEVKEKISESLTGRKLGPQSDEHRRKISESHKGKIIVAGSLKNSIEAMAFSNRTRIISEEERIRRGKAISEAIKAKGDRKASEAQIVGRKISSEKRKGVKRSQETKDKMRESWKKRKESGTGNGLQGKIKTVRTIISYWELFGGRKA